MGFSQAGRWTAAALAADANAESDALREPLHELHDEMRRLLREESPDETTVMRQAERIGAAETALRKQRLRTMLRIRAILTPEQRAELVEIYRERRGHEERDPPTD